MRNVSKQFKEALKNKNRHMLHWADITLTNGTTLNLDNNDLMQRGGLKIDDATSGSNSFDVGSVIINRLTLTLDNSEDEYSTYDFDGASVVAYLGLKLPDGTTERIRMGTYTVDEPKAVGSTVVLDCLDNIRLLDESYSKSTLQYPATLLQIVRDACECCGLSLNTKNFEYSDYTVESRPDDEATTFREVMSWVAQIACKFVRCDAYGQIFLRWYDESDYVEEFALTDERENKIHTDDSDEIIVFTEPSKAKASVDGGRFDKDTPYSSGDSMDGGLFNPWEDDGTSYDAGTFDAMKTYHHIWLLSSLTVGTDDINITGVSVTLENESGESSAYLYGDTGYILSIEKNDLIQSEDQAKSVAVMVGEKLVGMTFRTFSAGHLSDPTIEAGDTVFVTDRKQNSYKSYITNTVFTAGGTQKSSCGAETPARRSSTRFTEATKALAAAKKNTTQQINTYDKSVQALTNLITQSFGVYKSEEKLDDGSTIFYMHNKPTLEESDTIWKMTADAFAVSTDGGHTWNAGMDSQGNAVVNVLSAIGIRFDWAKGGTLTLGGEDNANGVLHVLDADGNIIVDLNGNIGADITGSITAKSRNYGYSVVVKDGAVTLYDPDGKRIGMFGWIGINENNTWRYVPYIRAIGNKEVSIEMDPAKGSMNITAESFSVSSSPGKSGKAEFSDGSYLQFVNGILVSGKTADGTTF